MASPWRVSIALTTGDKITTRCRSEDEARNLVAEVTECIETRRCPIVTHQNAEGQYRTTTINPAHIIDIWCYRVGQPEGF